MSDFTPIAILYSEITIQFIFLTPFLPKTAKNPNISSKGPPVDFFHFCILL